MFSLRSCLSVAGSQVEVSPLDPYSIERAQALSLVAVSHNEFYGHVSCVTRAGIRIISHPLWVWLRRLIQDTVNAVHDIINVSEVATMLLVVV